MTGNRLKLNNDKTEAFLGGSRRMLRVSEDNCLRVGDHNISFKFHVKNVGVYFDATLSVVKHVDHISRSAYLEIRRISSIRHLLTTKAAAQLMFLLLLLLLFCCFVFLYRLDYYNSLLIDISCDEMYKLPKIQNHAAKTGFRKSRHEQVKPLLKTLHLLPVKEGTIFKLATSVFRFFHGGYCVTIFVIISLCLHSSFQFG